MKITVFSKATEKYAPERLISEALNRGHVAENLFYSDLSIKIGPTEVSVFHKGEVLSVPDAAILRVSGAGLAGPLFVYQRVALLNHFREAFVANGDTYVSWPRLNKLEQHYSLVGSGLPVVPSFSFSSVESITWDLLKFPVIAKTIFGSSGQGVFKIDSKEQLLTLIEQKGINNLLIQKFLPTRQDYRVIVIGGRAIPVAMQKTAQEGEFLTNYARGGRVDMVPLKDEMRDLAEKTAEVFKADYAGIDIMYDSDGTAYILEINRGAQFRGFEESTGINVAGEVIKYLEEKVKDKI